MDANHTAEKSEFERKQKELEDLAMPIMAKLGGGETGGSGPFPTGPTGGANGTQTSGPTVDDLD